MIQPRHTWVTRVTAAIATGKHPDPSRTRKLSLPAPMVLPPRGGGRVGRRRTSFPTEATPAVASVALEGQTGSRDNPQHHSDDPREGDHPWPTSDATRVPPVDPAAAAAAAAAAGHSSGPPRPPGAAAAPRRGPGTSATVTRRAVSAAPGRARVRRARVTGRDRPRSSVRVRWTTPLTAASPGWRARAGG